MASEEEEEEEEEESAEGIELENQELWNAKKKKSTKSPTLSITVNASDLQGWKEIYQALNGNDWKDCKEFENSPCLCRKLTCSNDGYIEEIRLQNNNLKGQQIPVKALLAMKKLKVFDISSTIQDGGNNISSSCLSLGEVCANITCGLSGMPPICAATSPPSDSVSTTTAASSALGLSIGIVCLICFGAIIFGVVHYKRKQQQHQDLLHESKMGNKTSTLSSMHSQNKKCTNNIGIDFGTYEVKVYRKNQPVEKCKAVVVFDAQDGGNFLTGLLAEHEMVRIPANCYWFPKIFMKMNKSLSFPELGTQCMAVTPKAAISAILKHLFLKANLIGDSSSLGPPLSIVIGIPTSFGQEQRLMLGECISSSFGKTVKPSFVYDHEAIAYSYFSKNQESQLVLIVDIGYQFSSVCVYKNIARGSGVHERISYAHDSSCGSRLIDVEIVHQVLKATSSSSSSAQDLCLLFQSAMKARSQLSLMDSYSIKFSNQTICIKREENLYTETLAKIKDLLETVLTKTEGTNHLGTIILAGGTCRIPKIRESIEQIALQYCPCASLFVAQDFIVAEGCSIIADLRNQRHVEVV